MLMCTSSSKFRPQFDRYLMFKLIIFLNNRDR
jgi:hypothetical protein